MITLLDPALVDAGLERKSFARDHCLINVSVPVKMAAATRRIRAQTSQPVTSTQINQSGDVCARSCQSIHDVQHISVVQAALDNKALYVDNHDPFCRSRLKATSDTRIRESRTRPQTTSRLTVSSFDVEYEGIHSMFMRGQSRTRKLVPYPHPQIEAIDAVMAVGSGSGVGRDARRLLGTSFVPRSIRDTKLCLTTLHLRKPSPIKHSTELRVDIFLRDVFDFLRRVYVRASLPSKGRADRKRGVSYVHLRGHSALTHLCTFSNFLLDGYPRTSAEGRKLANGLLLLLDNASAYNVRTTKAAACDCGFDSMAHLLYSPNLTFGDFLLFPKLQHLRDNGTFDHRATWVAVTEHLDKPNKCSEVKATTRLQSGVTHTKAGAC
ncbi:hypothetical protein EVAR_56125_1 [Eumeta japonica]|uniref:Uncharacterized protein n=1 Tax=Eumeta variegata TaxID=151549 RepID=A0A4C1Z2L2_EUMVA|nr:hypothetical protein EVAR_56125_1 [Eumeta japonica]